MKMNLATAQNDKERILALHVIAQNDKEENTLFAYI